MSPRSMIKLGIAAAAGLIGLLLLVRVPEAGAAVGAPKSHVTGALATS